MENDKRYPVFVYGTLRHGFGNYLRLLKGNTHYEESAITKGEIRPVGLHGGFPCLSDNDEMVVRGDLMFIREDVYEEVMRSLDWLEGYKSGFPESSMYVRELRDVATERGTVKAWVYIWNREKPATDRIISGDWERYTIAKGGIMA
jgi:gamma-glutamylcyclotransferase (GGCT)/AIG2-like uncharacterized protein YtfP